MILVDCEATGRSKLGCGDRGIVALVNEQRLWRILTAMLDEMNLFEMAKESSHRVAKVFLRDESGRRPVYGGTEKLQTDPHWKDYILFYEYFHGDNGAGLGAFARQTKAVGD